MITVSQIRERLLDLLASDDPKALDEFDNWFAGASWNMHQDSAPSAQKFASEIELQLAAYDEGRVAEKDLRKSLSNLCQEYSLRLSSPEEIVAVRSSSTYFTQPAWVTSPADRSPAAASESSTVR